MFASYGIWEDLAHDLATILRIFETDPKSTSVTILSCAWIWTHTVEQIFSTGQSSAQERVLELNLSDISGEGNVLEGGGAGMLTSL